MLNIVLFGPPGAGKGTQSDLLIKKYNLIHLSTGDILRSEIAAGTKLGLEAKGIMDAGDLVPDQVVIDMISAKALLVRGFVSEMIESISHKYIKQYVISKFDSWLNENTV